MVNTIQCNVRSKIGGTSASLLRKNHSIPGVIYLKKTTNNSNDITCIHIHLCEKALSAKLEDINFMTKMIDLKINDKKTLHAIPREIQFHPVTGIPSHIDFMEVSPDDIITANVPISVINREHSIGVKRGGQVYIMKYNVPIKGKVKDIPEKITVDVAGSVTGAKYMLSSLDIPKGVSIRKDCLVVKISGGKASN